MVEAAGVGLLHRIENKQLIDSKGPLEAQETANTRFSSTLQVNRVQQSSRVPSSVRYQNTDQARGEAISRLSACGATGKWSTSDLPTRNRTFLGPGVCLCRSYLLGITIERSWCTGTLAKTPMPAHFRAGSPYLITEKLPVGRRSNRNESLGGTDHRMMTEER